MLHHCLTDWCDRFKTINVPTLIFGGKASFFKVSALEWMQRQMPGSRLEVFTEEENGAHFMFMENPGEVQRDRQRLPAVATGRPNRRSLDGLREQRLDDMAVIGHLPARERHPGTDVSDRHP